MSNDKVVVVSGQPRSGTSLMMQTMELLGLPVWGEKYPQEVNLEDVLEQAPEDKHEEIKKQFASRLEHAKKMNPRGFYEVPGLVMRGFRKLLPEHAGKAVKIIVDGLYDRENPNGHKTGTPEQYVDKVILCLRDPRNTAVSQMDLAGGVEVAAVDEETGEDVWANAGQPLSPKRYVSSMGQFVKWLADHDELDDRILPIEYADMHSQKPIKSIVEHLGIGATSEQVKAAEDNVDPLLNRSVDFKGWGNDDMEGALAEELHESLKTWNRSKFRDLAARADEMMYNWSLENVRWVDTEKGTWVTVYPQVFRDGGIDPIHPVLIPMSEDGCKFFSKGEKMYTIQRPLDLGDLTRHMVQCNRDDNQVTVEQCKFCWQRGSYRDGEVIEGQRHRKGAG